MRVWRTRICALVVVAAMTPGTFELMENAAHLVDEGHLAHSAADGDRHEPTGPEHGCTPIFHACGCHASLAFLGAPSPPATDLHAVGFSRRLAQDTRSAGFGPSVDHPPRA